MTLLLLLFTVPVVARAQERLSLEDAVARARKTQLSAQAATIGERDATLKLDEAQSGLLPRVDVVESWQRGNNPVFAFSSQLALRRFSERDFDVATLNRPDAIDNFRSALSLDQVLFDGTVWSGVRSAELERERAVQRRRLVEQDLATAL
jgi:outer membrane protein TolC